MTNSDNMKIRDEVSSEKRKWIRLTRVCNNRCIFCLDHESQDNTAEPFEDVQSELESGIREGSVRAILSGGEATIHPQFIEIVSEASRLGYKRIQVVSNGRMFAYKAFLDRAIAAGLHEITFSMHGHTEELHEAQTRVPGSFKQSLAGLINALRSRVLIVNIDIVINGMNYKYLDDIMGFYTALGIHEYDLLQITPYGDAWKNWDVLVYDPADAMKYLNKAFTRSKSPDMHVWTNRFPPRYMAEFPELVQSPLKLKDEVRGRAEFFEDYLWRGVPMMCIGERCKWCFLEGLCDEIKHARDEFDGVDKIESMRVSADEISAASDFISKHDPHGIILRGKLSGEMMELKKHFGSLKYIEFELDDYSGLEQLAKAMKNTKLRAVVKTVEAAESLRGISSLLLDIELNSSTADYVRCNAADLKKEKTRLRVSNYMSATESAEVGLDLREFFASVPDAAKMQTLNIPGCVIKTKPSRNPRVFDFCILDAKGRIDPQSITLSYIEHGYYVKPVSCDACRIADDCPGVHINYFRARGFSPKPFGK